MHNVSLIGHGPAGPVAVPLADLLQEVQAAAERGAAAALRAATAAQGPEDWLDSKGAARHLYRRDGATNAFRLLRHRHPELNKISSGEGNQRRWRRRDLDAWVRDHRPALSKGAADGR